MCSDSMAIARWTRKPNWTPRLLVKPEGFNIPYEAEQIHGISTALAEEQGVPLGEVLAAFNKAMDQTKFIVGQNVGFDINIMGCEFHREGVESPMTELPVLDTCTEHTAELCKIPGGRGGKFKLPTLTELHEFLFGEPLPKHIMQRQMLRPLHVVFESIRKKQYSTKNSMFNLTILSVFPKPILKRSSLSG